MKSLRAWLMRVAGMFSREQRRAGFDLELQNHIELQVEENLRAGMGAFEARRAALMKLGGLEKTRQAYSERGTVPFLETLMQDLRFAGRQLRKNPGFSVLAVLMLMVGVAASTAIFAFVDAALLKPLPYPKPDRLVEVTESVSFMPRANLSYLDYLDWKRMNREFQSMEAFRPTAYLLKTASGTEPVPGEMVSDGFFRTLGVAPLLGRDFYAGEDLPSGPMSVMLSFPAWQKYYGGRKSVVGEAVSLNGIPYTIVGVMPKTFEFAPRNNAEFWTALHATDSCSLRRSCHNLTGIARLNDGVSVATARANIITIAEELEREYPVTNRGQGVSVMSLSEAIVGDIRPILLTLLAGAGLLLLIACVNVSSLLLVRSESRKREIAVRGALGASPWRLKRQFITEGLILALIGSGLGMAVAYGLARVLVQLVSRDMIIHMPYLEGMGLNLRVFGFIMTVFLIAAVLFSLTPMSRLSSVEMREGLTEGARGSSGRGWRRLGANLVILELAVAVVLLVCAGLLGKSFYHLLHVDLNFEPQHLATAMVVLPDAVYAKDAQIVAVRREIVRRVGNLPGVTSASATTVIPTSCNCNTDWIRFVGRPYDGKHIEVNQRDVSAGYFTTLQTKLVRGRFFIEDEDAGKPLVAIINKAFAKKYFGNEDPVGKRMGDTELTPKSIKEIVGVVDDLREASLDAEIVPAVYYPIDQNTDSQFALVVRSKQDVNTLLPVLAPTIHAIDPGVGVVEEETMTQYISDSQSAYLHRSSAWMVTGFAGLALLLSTLGLYGVIAYSVSQREREIGVRMALGAQRSAVYRLILGEAGRLAGWGIAAGVVCSVGAAMLLRSLLFGVQAWDAGTLATVALLLGTSAMFAAYVPARRAASISPQEALRSE
ncbi:ABC transporter permease [Granulicella arctica]|uniref:ABC transporter permease n=1 Tax=Granulicella arctica TaxID=940613 RepID=UPI0021E041C1|nr:ABC transporter permease [Granulicella arctica]